jgi:hypothetical protein
MDLLAGLKAIRELIAGAFAGQAVRNDIIGNANQLATAILTAAGFACGRLNAALLASPTDRRRIVSKLTGDEIRAFANMNQQCTLILGSSNALSRWTSLEAANVNIAGRNEALQVLTLLQNAECGMQEFFNQLLTAPSETVALSDAEMERWLRDAIAKTCSLTEAANKCVRDLSKLL